MRILYCTRNDIKGIYALNEFLKNFDNEQHDLTVILSRKISEEEKTIDELIEYEFYECYMMDTFFKAIDLSPRNNHQGLRTFKELSKIYNFNLIEMTSPNSDKNFKTIQSLSPELIISCRYDYILRKKVIDLPKFGVLNIHPGILPYYRGVMAPFYSIINGESPGVTVHYIDEGIDTGNIIHTENIPVNQDFSIFDYYVELYLIGIRYISNVIASISENNKLSSYKQESGTYYGYPSKSQLDSFKESGGMIISKENYLCKLNAFLK